MISGNHFHPNSHVWLQRKIQFSGNHLPVDQNLRLWPENEFTLSFSLQFISGSRKTHSNTERKNAEKHKTHSNTEWARGRTGAPIHFPATESSDPAIETSDPATESSKPKTHSNTERVRERTHCSDLPHAGDVEFSQTITAQTNARTSSHRSRPTPDPAQPVDHRSSHSDHRAKHRLTVSFRNRFTVHTLTSPSTHTRPIHALTSPVRSLHFIYIYIYLFIYFFYLLIFLIINVLLNCVFMGYAYEILELFCWQVIEDWFLVWFFFFFYNFGAWLVMYDWFCCDLF